MQKKLRSKMKLQGLGPDPPHRDRGEHDLRGRNVRTLRQRTARLQVTAPVTISLKSIGLLVC